ncbi:ligase-associated DNA damage response endonuclease PdeM [Glaciecola sp. SC05]|uniref:ligase-associated DNA damage response endonuclease PdeM n=1 Tax=Glaciecola sp. SC05 TaxID=1987355 RepID=UPI003527EDF6
MIAAEDLHNLVKNNTVIPVRFCDKRLIVDGRGVLFWPMYDLLVFSDLHFEKGSFLTQFAHPLPRFDTRETISRMRDLINEYAPKQVLCLGDSFHDGNAEKRMQSDDIHAINTLIEKVEVWTWVLGNHDPDIPVSLGGERAHSLALDTVLFVHEPEDISTYSSCKGQIVGHFHPKTSYKLNNKKLTGKSFLIGEELLLMPAFGKYTGGLSSEHAAIKSLFTQKKPQILLTYHKKLFML